mmetsp:Transcript_1306/g.3050  ORF Transcript_1306/g.3050 Transcript_1306/m.3050 type:complete len:208 (+) Transcript_1306:842-1465(+)
MVLIMSEIIVLIFAKMSALTPDSLRITESMRLESSTSWRSPNFCPKLRTMRTTSKCFRSEVLRMLDRWFSCSICRKDTPEDSFSVAWAAFSASNSWPRLLLPSSYSAASDLQSSVKSPRVFSSSASEPWVCSKSLAASAFMRLCSAWVFWAFSRACWANFTWSCSDCASISKLCLASASFFRSSVTSSLDLSSMSSSISVMPPLLAL